MYKSFPTIFGFGLLLCSATAGAGTSVGDFIPLSSTEAAFVGVTVIPMDSPEVLLNQTVIVRDGRIANVGPAGEIHPSADALTIDGHGKFLMPGLADMHVHLMDENDLLMLLANGVTTVCNMAGVPMHLEIRERLRDAKLLGPMLYTTGPMIEAGNDPFFAAARKVESVADAKQLVEDTKSGGYDFVKMHGERSLEVYDAVFDAARKAGLRVVGHASESVGMKHALELGQATIEHAEEYIYCHFHHRPDASKMDEIVSLTKSAGTYVTPTLVAYDYVMRSATNIQSLLARPENRLYAQWKQANWGPDKNRKAKALAGDGPRMKRFFAFQKKIVRALNDKGVPLMTGTDYGGPAFLLPGFDVHVEIENLVSAGLSPYDALRAATVNPGRFIGESFGTISVGSRADLLLLDANPLEDVRNAKKPAGVMVRGQWLPKNELQRLVDQVVEQNERDERFLNVLKTSGIRAARAASRTSSTKETQEPACSQIALLWYGVGLVRQGDQRSAADVFKLATELYPESYLGFDLLGKAYFQAGKRRAALKNLHKAIKLNEHNVMAKRLAEKIEGEKD